MVTELNLTGGGMLRGLVTRWLQSRRDSMLMTCDKEATPLSIPRTGCIQWGSEYRPFEYRKHLNTQPFEVSISNGWVLKSMGYVLNRPFKTIWNLDKNVRILNGPVFWIVGTKAIAIAKALPFENLTIWNPTFKKSGFQMFPNFKWSDFRSPLYLAF